MSDINLDFTVANNNINFTVEPNDITFTPTDIQLTFNTSSQLNAGGSNTQVQYNNGDLLGGSSTFTFNNTSNVVTITNGVITNGVIANANIQNGIINASNITSAFTSLGNVGNVKITGGVNGYVLQTDGTGNLDWAAAGGGGGNGTPGGSNTQIQYNDSGVFGGNTGFTFNEVSGNVNIPGNLSVVGNIFGNVQLAYLANFASVANSVAGANISGTVANANYSAYAGEANTANLSTYATTANNVAGANVSGTVANATYATSAGSATTANTVTDNAQPNITSVGTLTTISVSGNANIGNIGTAGLITATGNVRGGNLITVGIVSATGNGTFGNIAGGNLITANYMSGTILTANQSYITQVGALANLRTTDGNIHLGAGSGQSGQGARSIAIGLDAGLFNQANLAIAVGWNAGSNTQGSQSVAIGRQAGEYFQGTGAVAIGSYAGDLQQGNYSIAVGFGAHGNVLAPGQPNNSIILNATGANLQVTNANSFVVKPIRNATQGNYLYYDSTTGEITFDTGTGGANTASGANTQVQFNTANLLDATANFTFNTSTNNLNVIGNITGTNFYGAGNGLSNIQGANISGAVSFATTANSVAGANVSGQVANAYNADVTRVTASNSGVVYPTFVSGNTTNNYGHLSNTVFKANLDLGIFYANAFSANVISSNTISATGINGYLTTAAQPNVTSVGTLTSLVATALKVTPTTVASLPSASSAGVGARSFVTDANSSPGTFGLIVTGGGGIPLPVFSDGSNWRIG